MFDILLLHCIVRLVIVILRMLLSIHRILWLRILLLVLLHFQHYHKFLIRSNCCMLLYSFLRPMLPIRLRCCCSFLSCIRMRFFLLFVLSIGCMLSMIHSMLFLLFRMLL